jgi:signal peptidase I
VINNPSPFDPAGTPAPERGIADENNRGRGRLFRLVAEIVETLALTLVIFLVIQNFVAQPFQVEGGSMERTFVQSDYVLVDRLTPRWSAYARGQVVVFQPPDIVARGEPFIKRVIGIAGDTVEVRDGHVFVNDAALDEPYLFRNAAGAEEPTSAGDVALWKVPAGDLFVMGDHREASEDSRVFGPIAVSSVIGRAVIRYWPLSELGVVATPVYTNVPRA